MVLPHGSNLYKSNLSANRNLLKAKQCPDPAKLSSKTKMNLQRKTNPATICNFEED